MPTKGWKGFSTTTLVTKVCHQCFDSVYHTCNTIGSCSLGNKCTVTHVAVHQSTCNSAPSCRQCCAAHHCMTLLLVQLSSLELSCIGACVAMSLMLIRPENGDVHHVASDGHSCEFDKAVRTHYKSSKLCLHCRNADNTTLSTSQAVVVANA